MNAIDAGLQAKLTGDATLVALVPGGIFQDEAPSAVNTAHLIWSLQTADDQPQFLGTAWEGCVYLIKAVAPSKGGADDGAARVKTLLDGGTMTVSGYTTMQIRRAMRLSYVESDGDRRWYHAGGLYALEVSP